VTYVAKPNSLTDIAHLVCILAVINAMGGDIGKCEDTVYIYFKHDAAYPVIGYQLGIV